MKLNLISVFLTTGMGSILMSPTVLHAHGENKSGPHGGEIRMPGAFHTEVLQSNSQTFRVFLLDIEFKNPTTVNSQVDATLLSGRKKIQLNCARVEDYFECKFDKKLATFEKAKKLMIQTTREGTLGAAVVYSLPIKTFR